MASEISIGPPENRKQGARSEKFENVKKNASNDLQDTKNNIRICLK